MRKLELDYDYKNTEELLTDLFDYLKIEYTYELVDNKVRFIIPKQEINCEIYDLDDQINIHIID
jgi:hypothetical protein